MLERFRALVVLMHDVVKELQAKAMAAEVEVEVDAGRGGPAAKIVSEIKKLFKLINVTGDDEVDDDGTLQPNARLALAEASASSTSSEILSPFRAAVGATRLAQRIGGPGSGSGSGPGLATPTAAGRGTLRSLAASNAAGMAKAGRGTVSSLYAFSPRGKEQKKSTQRMREREELARELRGLLYLDPKRVAANLHKVVAQPHVLLSLHRALTTTNPGGEPDNGEAVRQLAFFANSLHNRRLCQPPPVPQMKSWTCFTPHYQEEVACTMGGLHATTEDNASLLTILKSLHPDEWANLTERINLVDRTEHINNNSNSDSSSSSSNNNNNSSTPLDVHTHEEGSESGQDRYDRERAATRQQQLGREETEQAVQQWASDRTQVLSCTVALSLAFTVTAHRLPLTTHLSPSPSSSPSP